MGTIILALELVNNVIFWCLLCFVTSPQLLTEQVDKIGGSIHEGCAMIEQADYQAENMRVKLPGMKTVFTFKISTASSNGKPANDEIVQV